MQISFWTLLALLIACIGWIFRWNSSYIRLPFLFFLTCLGWLVPQLINYESSAFYDADGALLLNSYVILCTLAVGFGWMAGDADPAKRRSSRSFGRLKPQLRVTFALCIGLLMASIAIEAAIFVIAPNALASRMPTGIFTILSFLSNIKVVGLAASTILLLHRKDRIALLVFVSFIGLFLPDILVRAKRTDLLQLPLIIFTIVYFVRRFTLPRYIVVGGFLVAALSLTILPQLRGTSGYELSPDGALTATSINLSGDVVSNLEPSIKDWGHSEVENAVRILAYIERSREWTYGAQYWNRMVSLYVPGQLIGYENKKNLVIAYDVYDFSWSAKFMDRQKGHTVTGFSHSFADFYFLGFIVFFIMSFVMARYFRKACRGEEYYQILYSCSLILGALSVTHDSYYFFIHLPFYIVILKFCRMAQKV